jgi:hypothetical protein
MIGYWKDQALIFTGTWTGFSTDLGLERFYKDIERIRNKVD